MFAPRDVHVLTQSGVGDGLEDLEAASTDERRVGKEWLRLCRSLWSPGH